MDVHPLRGALFENMVINDMMKLDLNRGNNMQQLFFYRDKSQREVDVLRILPPNLVEAYEIKSAQTWNADFFAKPQLPATFAEGAAAKDNGCLRRHAGESPDGQRHYQLPPPSVVTLPTV